jgi:hypothetical protein
MRAQKVKKHIELGELCVYLTFQRVLVKYKCENKIEILSLQGLVLSESSSLTHTYVSHILFTFLRPVRFLKQQKKYKSPQHSVLRALILVRFNSHPW